MGINTLSERQPENVVICIDTSRSMFRTHYPPNRFQICKDAIKKLISERFAEDTNTSFAVVQFSDKPKTTIGFTGIKSELYSALETLAVSGRSAMGEALGLSIKLIITELRKLAGKLPRILVISDGNYTKSSVDPLKMARLAQGLNIKIDVLRLGEVSTLNVLKRMFVKRLFHGD